MAPLHQRARDAAGLEGSAKTEYVTGMFNRIAGPYDRLNQLISLGRAAAWRREALEWAGVEAGLRAVDLGTGTGDIFLELRRMVGTTGSVIGLDVAEGMLEVARHKAEHDSPDAAADLRLGSAESTGLPDSSADVVTMGWVLRNVGNREATYREILRVLAPGGIFLCIDMSRPDNPLLRAGSAVYLRGVMPVVVRAFGGDVEAYRYLCHSTGAFPRRDELAAEWRRAGFEDVATRTFMLGSVAAHTGRKPRTT